MAELTRQAVSLKQEQYAIGEALLKAFPNDFNALRVMGYVHSSHGNREKMFQCWDRCRQLQPNRADIYDQLGRYAVQNEKYREAIAYWQRVVEIDPKFHSVYQRIGFAYLNLGEAEQARMFLARQIELSPSASQAHYLMGEAAFQMQELKKAQLSYATAAKLEPNNSKAYYGLIKTSARLGETERAAKAAKKFQELEAAASEADLEHRKEFDDLEQMREKLAVTCVDAGKLYVLKEQPERAKQIWQRATEVDSTNSQARSLLVSIFVKERNVPAAINQLQQLVRLEPENANHYAQLGFLHARQGKLPAAEAAFRQVIKLQPKKSLGYRSLAKFYLSTKQNLVAARNLAISSVKLEPSADGFFVLGWASAMNGKQNEARAALKKAIQLNPKDINYRKLLEAVEKPKPPKK